MEVRLEKTRSNWSDDTFNELRQSINTQFHLNSKSFALKDPADDFFIDDIDDLQASFDGRGRDYVLVLKVIISQETDHAVNSMCSIDNMIIS